jgi:RHS repeat-associated protein
VANGATTDFFFNAAGQRDSEWNGSTGAQLKGHYYWGSSPVAFYTTVNAPGGAAAHFEHQDWLGTERMRTTYNAAALGTSGGVEGQFASLPWGDSQTTTSGSDKDAYHYAMVDYDGETNTDHAEFRQYSPTEGRWLRPDPYSGSYDMSNPQSFNRYEYAMNNPLSNIDPSGLDCYEADENGVLTFLNSGDCPANTDYIWVPDGTQPPQPPVLDVTVWAPYYYDQIEATDSQFVGGYQFSGSYMGMGNVSEDSGYTGSNAPSNGTPWYKNSCITGALAKGAATAGLDAIGLLPEGGVVSAAFSLWHGAAGISNGRNIQRTVAFGAGIITAASGANDLSNSNGVNPSSVITGISSGVGVLGIAKSLGAAIPVAGQVIAGVSVGLDVLGTIAEVAECH